MKLVKPAHARPEHTIALSLSKCRRGFALVVVLVVAALIIGFGTTLGYQKLKTKPSPSPTPAINQTQNDLSSETSVKEETVYTDKGSANWKTYTGTSFTFKYPLDWIINAEDKNVIVLKESPTQEGASIIVYSVDNPKNLTAEQAVTITPNEGGVCCISRYLLNENVKRENLTVSGLEAKRFIQTNAGPDNVYVFKGGKIINISNTYGEVPRVTFDQILSTFRFLD